MALRSCSLHHVKRALLKKIYWLYRSATPPRDMQRCLSNIPCCGWIFLLGIKLYNDLIVILKETCLSQWHAHTWLPAGISFMSLQLWFYSLFVIERIRKFLQPKPGTFCHTAKPVEYLDDILFLKCYSPFPGWYAAHFDNLTTICHPAWEWGIAMHFIP